MPSEPASWRLDQRLLHWTMAALVAVAAVLALLMVEAPPASLLTRFLVYQWHKTAGLLVLALALIRLPLRLAAGRPAWEAATPPWRRRLAGVMHAALWVLLLCAPVLGYVAASLAPVAIPTLLFGKIALPALLSPSEALYPIARQIHRAAAFLLVVLALGHAGAAIQDALAGGRSLSRMWRGGSGAVRRSDP